MQQPPYSIVFDRVIPTGPKSVAPAGFTAPRRASLPPTAVMRRATPADLPAVTELMLAAAHGLNSADYNPIQLAAALKHMFTIDTELLADGHYTVVEINGRIAGGAGWSQGALHGGSHVRSTLRDAALTATVNATTANIRSVYVHPDFARRGIGRLLMQITEDAARVAGMTRLELVATLTGEPLYHKCGYTVVERFEFITPEGIRLPAVKMEKQFAPQL